MPRQTSAPFESLAANSTGRGDGGRGVGEKRRRRRFSKSPRCSRRKCLPSVRMRGLAPGPRRVEMDPLHRGYLRPSPIFGHLLSFPSPGRRVSFHDYPLWDMFFHVLRVWLIGTGLVIAADEVGAMRRDVLMGLKHWWKVLDGAMLVLAFSLLVFDSC